MFTTFKCTGFKAPQNLIDYGNETVAVLADRTPMSLSCTAQVGAKVVGSHIHYTCHVELITGLGVFLQESTSTEPEAAIDGAVFKIRRQMGSWVIRHFASTGDLNLLKLNKLTSKLTSAALAR